MCGVEDAAFATSAPSLVKFPALSICSVLPGERYDVQLQHSATVTVAEWLQSGSVAVTQTGHATAMQQWECCNECIVNGLHDYSVQSK